MKTGNLATLLLIAGASLFVEVVNANNGDQMCPHEYFKKHPEVFQKVVKMMKENKSSVDFSQLQSCSEKQKCPENRICCHSPCGMKCMRPITEKNAEEVLALTHKDIEIKENMEPYVETEDDKKFGMCPENYLRTHPEFKERLEKEWEQKFQQHHREGQCKGKDCPSKQKENAQQHMNKLHATAACSMDGDCSNQMRCCRTMCGYKCMKPVFTEEDYKMSVFGHKEENKQKRDLLTQEEGPDSPPEEELDHDSSQCEHGRCKKNRKNRNGDPEEESEKGDEPGRGHGKRKGNGKGSKHSEGCRKSKKHGKGKGKGLQAGKGHGKGARRGEGDRKELENDDDHSESLEDKGHVEQLREKRLAKFRADDDDDNDNGNGQRRKKEKGKGKKGGKGKKNKKGKCNGKGKSKGKSKGRRNEE